MKTLMLTGKTAFMLCVVAWQSQFSVAQVMSTQEYIDAYKFAAMQEMKIYNIPASITLGQGILESGSGNSKLARDCNNHFGIKCRKEWTGTFCLADDDAPNECFRGYASAMESYRDHSLFLKGSSRYSALFALPVTDYEAWAKGLRDAGYATNPAYATMLSGLIKKYRLTMYDSMALLGEDYVSPDTAAQRQIMFNGLPAVYAKPGETPEMIAKDNEMGAWQIYKYNDLKRGTMLDPGEIVYLKPKKRKGSIAVATVKEGQDMRDVSQQYGIKLKHLYKKNNLKPGQQVRPGEVLSLQSKNPETPATIENPQPDTQPDVKPPNKPMEKPQTPVPAPAPPKDTISDFYEVKPGETLYAVALKFGIAADDLVRWNKLSSTTLKPGQVLVLKPGSSANAQDTTRPAAQSQVTKSLKYHVVIKGETVYSIARLYNQSPDSILAWNKIVNGIIYPGREIIVSKNGVKTGSTTIPISYTVQPGDTLYGIARRYGVSVDFVLEKNNLQGDKINVGQVLLLQ